MYTIAGLPTRAKAARLGKKTKAPATPATAAQPETSKSSTCERPVRAQCTAATAAIADDVGQGGAGKKPKPGGKQATAGKHKSARKSRHQDVFLEQAKLTSRTGNYADAAL